MRLLSTIRERLADLVTPQVDDRLDRAHWYQEMYSDLSSEVERLRREIDGSQRRRESSEAATAWREDPRLRRMLKMNAAQVTGHELAVVVQGDVKVGQFIEKFVNDPRNSLPGFMVSGSEGFLLRIMDWYLACLRDGDLFIVLYPQADGSCVVRSRPAQMIAHVATNPEDWEEEIWYAEVQSHLPPPEEYGNRSAWETTWDPPSPATIREPEMLHYAYDRLDGSATGESLAQALIPWTEEYAKLLTARVKLNEALAKIVWLVDMPGADPQIRSERKRFIEASHMADGGFICQDSESEAWTAVNASAHGGDANPDLEAVLKQVYVIAGVVPFWSGEITDANRASSRSVTPVALAALRIDQKRYFGFLQGILSRAVEKWLAVTGQRVQPWSITVVSADTTDYELLESGQAMKAGVDAVTLAHDRGLIDDELAQALTLQFAGMPQEIGEAGGVTRISLATTRMERERLAARRTERQEDAELSAVQRQIEAQEDQFQAEVRQTLEAAGRGLLTEIEEISDLYDETPGERRGELLERLNDIDVYGEEQYRDQLADWLDAAFEVAAQAAEVDAVRPPWLDGWVRAQATALADRHFNELKTAAVLAALQQITEEKGAGVTPFAAENAIRNRFSSSIQDWDAAARAMMDRMEREGVFA